MARILLIDDDQPLRAVMAAALQMAGHEVIQAADGRQGVELSRAAPCDLVITDLVMPVQEGVETIIILRHEQPKLPIIAISGGRSNAGLYLDIAHRIGADQVLNKPFSSSELNEAVTAVLQKAKG